MKASTAIRLSYVLAAAALAMASPAEALPAGCGACPQPCDDSGGSSLVTEEQEPRVADGRRCMGPQVQAGHIEHNGREHTSTSDPCCDDGCTSCALPCCGGWAPGLLACACTMGGDLPRGLFLCYVDRAFPTDPEGILRPPRS